VFLIKFRSLNLFSANEKLYNWGFLIYRMLTSAVVYGETWSVWTCITLYKK
jgi:hypothetical protein